MLDGRPRRTLWDPLLPAEASDLLRDGGYGLSLEFSTSGELRLTGPGTGIGLRLGSRPTWATLFRALIRLRRTRQVHDPVWLDCFARLLNEEQPETPTVPDGLVEIRGATEDTPVPVQRALDEPHQALVAPGARFDATDQRTAQRRMNGWSRLKAVVETDPLLRLYCALQPTPVALMDAGGDWAATVRLIEPAPAHPAYPGGTIAVGMHALLRSGVLRAIVANRFERWEDELRYFLEHFVRPLVRTFRVTFDAHELSLCALDERGLAFELSPELQATGRIVVTDPQYVGRDAGAGALLGTLDELTETFSREKISAGQVPGEVRAAVDTVIAEELRHLRQHSAESLSGGPLQRFLHTVPTHQDRVLKDVLHTVQERTRLRRRDPRTPRPTVVIDLDLCGIVPLQRTLDATRAIAGPRPGAPNGIEEFAHPRTLTVLPTYAESTWRNFLEINGLDRKYPGVDWDEVCAEFFAAFARPWEKLRTDTVNAGLARFVWDVRDAGGRVIFCTGRRERVREYTQEVLAVGGVPDAVLLCMPDGRTRPISELKVEMLRALEDVDLVAFFDDTLANRMAVAKEFTGARVVAVEIPGVAAERPPGQPSSDGAPIIANFETMPRTEAGQVLSNTHSLEELQLGALRDNRPAHRWAAHLTMDETHRLVDALLSDVDESAMRTAQRAKTVAGLDGACGPGDYEEHGENTDRVIRGLHHVFTRKQFLKGSRTNYQCPDMRRDADTFVRQRRPIEVVLLGFPVKQCLNRLKASGPLPDLAELGGLARLRELSKAARAIYPPGLHFNILTDGRHFRPRSAAITGAYTRKLRQYVDLVGLSDHSTIQEIDHLAQQRLGDDLFTRRSSLLSRYSRELEEALRGFDIGVNPLHTLDLIDEHAQTVDPPLAHSLRLFRDMFMSMVYSVPVPFPAGVDRLTWSRMVFADLYHPKAASSGIQHARLRVLRRAWHTVIRYLATLRIDEELGYEQLLPHRVRLTVSAARPGRCGFTYLGGSGLLPWQGTGVVERRGQLAVDFAVALADQAFVPVYSPLLGPRQPWMMVAAQHTRTSRDGTSLDPALFDRIRLRRK